MPAIARMGDSVLSRDGTGFKCRQPMQTSIAEGNSKNVFANGILVSVQGNKVSPHTKATPECAQDMSIITSYSSTIKIGGLGVARIGDVLTDPTTSNTITQGSSNVFAGG